MKTILLTGGMGYIGSHTCVELIGQGYEPIIVDDLSNSSPSILDGIKKITGVDVPFYQINVADKASLSSVFYAHDIDAVIHFAGFKAVGESYDHPLKYYKNNLNSTINLLSCMRHFEVKHIVFSSSATVYDSINYTVLGEDSPRWCANPYGWTKFMSEQIISDYIRSAEASTAVLLRYFNPVGAHESGFIGEVPTGVPQNLMPFVSQVATGQREKLFIFGDDYETPDGTCIRDYIHITDLAQGHVAALSYCQNKTGSAAINLGTGKSTSVLELVNAFEEATGVKVPYEVVGRRSGDVAEYYAETSYAKEILGWEAKLSLKDMCKSAYEWEKRYSSR